MDAHGSNTASVTWNSPTGTHCYTQAQHIRHLEQQLRAQKQLADIRKDSAAEVGELSGDLVETRRRLKVTQNELSTKAEQLSEVRVCG